MFIGNIHTLVYHEADSTNLPAPENQIFFASEAEAVAAGYHPMRDSRFDFDFEAANASSSGQSAEADDEADDDEADDDEADDDDYDDDDDDDDVEDDDDDDARLEAMLDEGARTQLSDQPSASDGPSAR